MTLWTKIHRIEHLGADRLLYGTMRDTFPNEKVIINIPFTMEMRISPQETYEFAVKEKDIKFFDRSTGLRTEPRRFWEKRS